MNRQEEQGFTLIELMVVIAILALLALFAFPQYSNHTQRTKVTGALNALAAIKVAVSTCVQETGVLTNCSSAKRDIPGLLTAGSQGSVVQYVDALSVTDGVISVTTTGKNAANALMTLTLTPVDSDQGVRWQIAGTGCDVVGGINNPRGIHCTTV